MNASFSRSHAPFPSVIILGNDAKLCPGCGPGVSELQLTDTVRLGLAKRYGQDVPIEYHDLRVAGETDRYSDLLRRAKELSIPLPLVVVDGSIIQGGGIDFKAIVNAIDVKVEQVDR